MSSSTERGPGRLRRILERAQDRPDVIHDEIIAFSPKTQSARSVEVAMQWTTSYSESVHTYANTINTHEGRTHEEGFRAALTTLVNKYAREKGLQRGPRR